MPEYEINTMLGQKGWLVTKHSSLLHKRIILIKNITLDINIIMILKVSLKHNYRILLSIMHIQVQCTLEFQNHFWQNKIFLFFKNNFTRINHCKFIHHKSHLKTFLSYLPCIMPREYFSTIFNVKKCTLYLIKYDRFYTEYSSIEILH